MKHLANLPAGYRSVEPSDFDNFKHFEMRGVTLSEGEVIEIQGLIDNDTGFTRPDGECVKIFRFMCKSSLKGNKPRLLPISFFDPYPKHRIEFMRKSQFFKDVLEFQGNKAEFIEWLENMDRKLIVMGSEDLEYKQYGTENYLRKPFYLLEYAF